MPPHNLLQCRLSLAKVRRNILALLSLKIYDCGQRMGIAGSEISMLCLVSACGDGAAQNRQGRY